MEKEVGGGFRSQVAVHPLSAAGVCILSMKPVCGHCEHPQACSLRALMISVGLLIHSSIFMHIIDPKSILLSLARGV